MLTRIRNAQRAGRREVVMPASKVKLAIARILEREGFVERVERAEDGPKANLSITLKYERVSAVDKLPAIQEINRVSKEGLRVYLKKGDVRRVKNGYGISIISTSAGVMTGNEARAKGLGGECICEVW